MFKTRKAGGMAGSVSRAHWQRVARVAALFRFVACCEKSTEVQVTPVIQFFVRSWFGRSRLWTGTFCVVQHRGSPSGSMLMNVVEMVKVMYRALYMYTLFGGTLTLWTFAEFCETTIRVRF